MSFARPVLTPVLPFGRVAIIGASNIVIDGNGKTFDYSAAVGLFTGLGTLAPATGAVTIKNLTFVGPANAHGVWFQGDELSLLNTTMANGKMFLELVRKATIADNSITSSPSQALEIRRVPASSTYSITDNDLSNAVSWALLIGKVQDPGVTLTLTGNTFDGSRNGARLNNILGPFTLSPADNNTFAGAG